MGAEDVGNLTEGPWELNHERQTTVRSRDPENVGPPLMHPVHPRHTFLYRRGHSYKFLNLEKAKYRESVNMIPLALGHHM